MHASDRLAIPQIEVTVYKQKQQRDGAGRQHAMVQQQRNMRVGS